MTRRVALLGATGRVGRAVLHACLERDLSVRALVRDASRLRARDGVEVIEGSVLSLPDVEEVLFGTDAAVTALGTPPYAVRTITAPAVSVLIEAMKRSAAKRLIAVSAHGIGESRSQVDVVSRCLLGLPFPYVRDKLAMEHAVRHSGLNWTLVRPWLLRTEPARGIEARTVLERRPRWLTFAEIGEFIAGELEHPAFERVAVSLSGR